MLSIISKQTREKTNKRKNKQARQKTHQKKTNKQRQKKKQNKTKQKKLGQCTHQMEPTFGDRKVNSFKLRIWLIYFFF